MTAYLRSLQVNNTKFSITTEHGPAYIRTTEAWIDVRQGGYGIRKSVQGRYKRTHKGAKYHSEEVGPTYATYEEVLPDLAALFFATLRESYTYADDLFQAINAKREESKL